MTKPIRLHVAAKRYLTARQPAYLAGLSRASLHSLKLQGGPFAADELEAFLALPHAREAVRLRRWDEGAKLAGVPTPPLEHFRGARRNCLVERASDEAERR